VYTTMTLTKQKEFGDYQTPIHFTDLVCDYLKKELNLSPKNIIEPTCGKGNFLVSCLNHFPNSTVHGIEINQEYLDTIREKTTSENLYLYNEDIFDFDFEIVINNFHEKTKTNNLQGKTRTDTLHGSETLIIGNPPWVNNSNLSKIDSKNLPKKSNFKGKKGIDSITGSSNFDIAESIILKAINDFKNTNTTVSFLCKISVAREVFKELKRTKINFNFARIINFDAEKIFNISVEACIFIVNLTKKTSSKDYCEVYDIESTNKVKNKFGFRNNKFYSNLNENLDQIDGKSPLQWRQGVKHDCSKLMELKKEKNYHINNYINKNNEKIDIEDTLVYPLIKSSDFKKNIINKSDKYVIVTQKKLRQDTDYIEKLAPKTWNYLKKNEQAFNNRKSKIYKNSPPFAMFGIGDYTFSKYKVGISGFYKTPVFSLLDFDKAVMLDDTCYFLSFENYQHAYITMLILNSNLVQNFLKNIAFLDSKRPYTKKILKRIDLKKSTNLLNIDDLINTEKNLNLPNNLKEEDYNDYKNYLNNIS